MNIMAAAMAVKALKSMHENYGSSDGSEDDENIRSGR
jgi:hypothetical protein